MSSLRPVSGTAPEVLALLRDWDAADDPEPLVIETSGSTGRPKRVVLSRDAMRASALATQERLGGPGQWVLNLPPTYVAGVQVLFRSVVAGTEPVVEADLTVARKRLTAAHTFVSLVPTQLVRALADDDATDALSTFTAVLVGGGPLSAVVRAEAEEAGVPVVQTYGMSETCGGCVYDGRPLDGVEVRIDAGQVLLRGPMLFDGYQGDPEQTATVLRDGWLSTNDLGHLDDTGRLWIEGRTDDVIISGGLKIPAQAVGWALEADPDVSEAHVLGLPDPEWGERVVAVLVGRGADDELPPHAAEALVPREWWPKEVRWVRSMPRLSNGKTDRAALRELFR
ncbi:MAG: AMP-binding protein [Marmoricola sp.]